MYINTKPVIDIVSKYMPMLSREEVIAFVVKKVTGSNGEVAIKKWGSGAFLYSFGSTVEQLRTMLTVLPETVDEREIFFKELPSDAKVALEPKGGEKEIEIVSRDEWIERRARIGRRGAAASPATKQDKAKLVEILAEIATVEHANGLKLDNLCRLMMKTNEALDELCEAWKGKA